MTMDMRRMTWYALGALVVGLLIGAAMESAHVTILNGVVRVLEPIGTVWINAVRMTIIPLVVSMLIAAVGSSDSLRSMGRMGGMSLLYFVASMALIALYTAFLAGP